jgi:hypothetical protein
MGKVLPVVTGQGDTDMLCGNCRAMLVQAMNQGQLRNLVIHCPVCRHYVEIP